MSEITPSHTPIKDIGEFGLIERLANIAQTVHPAVTHSIGDDAAVLSSTSSDRLICKDMFCAGVHFETSYTPLSHIGYKSIVACLSDIAAMNGTAEAVLVGLGISSMYSVENMETLYQGIAAACKQYQVALVGGDTTAIKSGLTISVTATGTTTKPIYRHGAQENDLLCISGPLGGAYLGLQILRREEYAAKEEPILGPYEELLERQLKPRARFDALVALRERGVTPTAMIDVSDGLFSEILHLAKASNIGVEVQEEALPITPLTYQTALELNLSPTTCACHGGEDYELLCTVPAGQAAALDGIMHVIGKITPASCVLITKQGRTLPITAQGWVHFPSSDSQ